TITAGGQTRTPTTPCGAGLSACSNIAGNYGNNNEITISKITTTQEARVIATDGNSDVLQLVNARVKNNTASDQVVSIIFERDYNPGPTGAPNYKYTIAGMFQDGV